MPPNDDLVMTYTATFTEDYLSRTNRAQYTPHNGSKTLAVERVKGRLLSLYVHGNSQIVVRRGTTDVSKKYAIRRRWRAWEAPLDPNGDTRSSAYVWNEEKTVPHFQLDSGEKPLGEWFDAPGWNLMFREARTTRVLFEWVIGCERSYDRDLQEGIGGLHLFVIVDTSPGGYRIGMSRAYDLTEGQVRAVIGGGSAVPSPFPNDRPLKTEDDIPAADWLARHTTWQSYASLMAQLPLPSP
jgi:hypothetical protein